MSKSKYIIVYDLDGTLLDTLEDICAAANNALKDVLPNAPHLELPIVRRMVGDGAKILMERMLVAASSNSITPDKSLLDAAYQAFMKRYSEDKFEHTKPYDGVVEGLTRFHGVDCGVTQVICTNKPEVIARNLIANSSLAQFFFPIDQAVIGAVQTLPQKPDPNHIRRAIESCTGLADFDPTKVFVVGDGANDIKAAHALKCRSVGVSYGFSDRATLESLNPSIIVDRFEDATKIIEEWMKTDLSKTIA